MKSRVRRGVIRFVAGLVAIVRADSTAPATPSLDASAVAAKLRYGTAKVLWPIGVA